MTALSMLLSVTTPQTRGNQVLMGGRKAIYQMVLILAAFGHTDPQNLLRPWYPLLK